MKQIFRIAAAAAVVVLIVVVVLVLITGRDDDDGGGDVDLSAYPYPVQETEQIEDRSHFPVGQTYDDYNSNPPTSGPHAAAPAPWGVSDLAVPKETAVHNMEHAGVVVWYNCNADPLLDTSACATLRNQLTEVVAQEVGAGRSVLMTPYPGMDSRIALTSWGYLDAFDEFDADRVRMFIETFECNIDLEGFC